MLEKLLREYKSYVAVAALSTSALLYASCGGDDKPSECCEQISCNVNQSCTMNPRIMDYHTCITTSQNKQECCGCETDYNPNTDRYEGSP